MSMNDSLRCRLYFASLLGFCLLTFWPASAQQERSRVGRPAPIEVPRLSLRLPVPGLANPGFSPAITGTIDKPIMAPEALAFPLQQQAAAKPATSATDVRHALERFQAAPPTSTDASAQSGRELEAVMTGAQLASFGAGAVAVEPGTLRSSSNRRGGLVKRALKAVGRRFGFFPPFSLEATLKLKQKVNAFAVTPDLKTVLTGHPDGTIQIFQRQAGARDYRNIGKIELFSAILSLGISDDGKTFVAGTIKLKAPIYRFDEIDNTYKQIALASSQRISISRDGTKVSVIPAKGLLTLLEVQDNNAIQNAVQLTSVALDINDKPTMALGGNLVAGLNHGRAVVYQKDARQRNYARIWKDDQAEDYFIAISEDGKTMAVVDFDYKVRMFRRSGHELSFKQFQEVPFISSIGRRMSSAISLSADGKFMVVGDKALGATGVFRLNAATLLFEQVDQKEKWGDHGVSSAWASPDGKSFAVGGDDGRVQFYSAADGSESIRRDLPAPLAVAAPAQRGRFAEIRRYLYNAFLKVSLGHRLRNINAEASVKTQRLFDGRLGQDDSDLEIRLLDLPGRYDNAGVYEMKTILALYKDSVMMKEHWRRKGYLSASQAAQAQRALLFLAPIAQKQLGGYESEVLQAAMANVLVLFESLEFASALDQNLAFLKQVHGWGSPVLSAAAFETIKELLLRVYLSKSDPALEKKPLEEYAAERLISALESSGWAKDLADSMLPSGKDPAATTKSREIYGFYQSLKSLSLSQQ